VSLIATLIAAGMVVEICDITQAYTQSKTKLKRLIVAKLPIKMRDKYLSDSLLLVEGLLYRIPEAGVHWFETYQAHHLERLDMETSTYDPCLLISKQGDENFGLVSMQTDDTLLISIEKFSRDEQNALQEASFKVKPKTRLSEDSPIEFNGARVILLKDGNITLRQKGQTSKIQPVGKEDRA
jgi:hypothetical protein